MKQINLPKTPSFDVKFFLRFRSGFNQNRKLLSSKKLTILYNSILVLYSFKLRGPTENIGIFNYRLHPDELILQLQEH